MTTTAYPFDSTGRASTNLVSAEIHTLSELQEETYRIFIPKFAPFHLNNLSLVHVDQTGNRTTLVEGPDYSLVLDFIEASRSIGSTIYGGVMVHRENLTGTLLLTYQTLGGVWADFDKEAILTRLAELVYNARTTVWGSVVELPYSFPVVNHSQSADETKGYDDLIEAFNRLIATAAANPSTQHIALMAEMLKSVTKTQVGLGDVENLPPATTHDIASRNSVRKYITLDQALVLINSIIDERI